MQIIFNFRGILFSIFVAFDL